MKNGSASKLECGFDLRLRLPMAMSPARPGPMTVSVFVAD
jgi:hypothetical protein